MTDTFSAAVALLAAESDEQKFAGLILITHVLKDASDEQCQAVYSALGTPFLTRLLLPLRDPRFIGTVEAKETLERQLAGVTLALSVTAALTRSTQIASQPALHELLACLSNLLSEQSIAAACHVHDRTILADQDMAACTDALEAVCNMCITGPAAQSAALKASTLPGLCAWLQANVATASLSAVQTAIATIVLLAGCQPHVSQAEFTGALAAISHACAVELPDDARPGRDGCAAGAGTSTSSPSVKPAAPPTSTASTTQATGALHKRTTQLMTLSLVASLIDSALLAGAPLAEAVAAAVEQRADWLQDLQAAVERALLHRLPVQHLQHALRASLALVRACGPWALVVVGRAGGGGGSKRLRGDCGARDPTRLLSLLVACARVHTYTHLQRCVLEPTDSVRTSRSSHQLDREVCMMCLQLDVQVVHLLMQLEDDDAGLQGTELPTEVLSAADAEGKLVALFRQLADTVDALLDFISHEVCPAVTDEDDASVPAAPTCSTWHGLDCRDDGAEKPATVSAGDETKGHETGGDTGGQSGNGDAPPLSPLFEQLVTTSAAAAEAAGEGEEGGAADLMDQTVGACARLVSVFVSAAPGPLAEKAAQLLPGLGTWLVQGVQRDHEGSRQPFGCGVRRNPRTLTLVVLLPLLYAVAVQQLAGKALAATFRQRLATPEMLLALCMAGFAMCEAALQHSDGLAWKTLSDMQFPLLCELLSTVASGVSASGLQDCLQLACKLGLPCEGPAAGQPLGSVRWACGHRLVPVVVRLAGHLGRPGSSALTDVFEVVLGLTELLVGACAVVQLSSSTEQREDRDWLALALSHAFDGLRVVHALLLPKSHRPVLEVLKEHDSTGRKFFVLPDVLQAAGWEREAADEAVDAESATLERVVRVGTRFLQVAGGCREGSCVLSGGWVQSVRRVLEPGESSGPLAAFLLSAQSIPDAV